MDFTKYFVSVLTTLEVAAYCNVMEVTQLLQMNHQPPQMNHLSPQETHPPQMNHQSPQMHQITQHRNQNLLLQVGAVQLVQEGGHLVSAWMMDMFR